MREMMRGRKVNIDKEKYIVSINKIENKTDQHQTLKYSHEYDNESLNIKISKYKIE